MIQLPKKCTKHIQLKMPFEMEIKLPEDRQVLIFRQRMEDPNDLTAPLDGIMMYSKFHDLRLILRNLPENADVFVDQKGNLRAVVSVYSDEDFESEEKWVYLYRMAKPESEVSHKMIRGLAWSIADGEYDPAQMIKKTDRLGDFIGEKFGVNFYKRPKKCVSK